MSDFVARNKLAWSELEELVARAKKRIGRMQPEELARLDSLYRRTTIHLAQVTTRTNDAQLAKYLNDLTAAAHSIIYLPPRKSAFAGAIRFVTEGFARAVARTWKYQAAAAALSLPARLSPTTRPRTTRSRPIHFRCRRKWAKFACQAPPAERLRGVLTHGRDKEAGEKFAFASFLFSHNLEVGVLSLCLGILAGVPTIFLLIYNGMVLGSFTALHHQAGIYEDYWAWILPHAMSELTAIILCGGAGLEVRHGGA